MYIYSTALILSKVLSRVPLFGKCSTNFLTGAKAQKLFSIVPLFRTCTRPLTSEHFF